jgi:hypothetical protein
MLKLQHYCALGNIDKYPFDVIETFVLETIQNHNQRRAEERNRVTKIDKAGAGEKERNKERKKRRKREKRKES